MNFYKKIGLCLVLAAAFFRANADAPQTGTDTPLEQTYTNNVYLGLSSTSFFSGGVIYPKFGYFFSNNNQWSVALTVLPYNESLDKYSFASLANFRTLNWTVQLGAEIFNYIPIARKCFNNRMFVYYGPSWLQIFDANKTIEGTADGTRTVTRGDWQVDLSFGLQYRFNDHLYLGVDTPFFLYTKDVYDNYTNGVYVSRTTDIDWYFFGGAANLNLIWKF
ncbi:MAG: hypothetical protein S4CHLAM7_11460 [Chlamydiae bacterium]|nr:hypothetical protein [Chlamydiota bacterium]